MIKHHFFTRHGGVSTGSFSSLNLDDRHGDNVEDVQQNKSLVLQESGGTHLCMMDQVHGKKCKIIKEAYSQPPKVDALVTKNRGLSLGVLTADCAPVLFAGKTQLDEDVIGAAHAGWRSAFDGVCEETISAMQSIGCEISSIKAWIGPCIGQKSYEVTEAFKSDFLLQSKENNEFFISSNKTGHVKFDLSGYLIRRLERQAISEVYNDGRDTYEFSNDFFSYRRVSHEGRNICGRQISTITIL